MVVPDFDLVGMTTLPLETYPELSVDPDTVQVPQVAPQQFQPVSRGYKKLREFTNPVDLVQLSPGNDPKDPRTTIPSSA